MPLCTSHLVLDHSWATVMERRLIQRNSARCESRALTKKSLLQSATGSTIAHSSTWRNYLDAHQLASLQHMQAWSPECCCSHQWQTPPVCPPLAGICWPWGYRFSPFYQIVWTDKRLNWFLSQYKWTPCLPLCLFLCQWSGWVVQQARASLNLTNGKIDGIMNIVEGGGGGGGSSHAYADYKVNVTGHEFCLFRVQNTVYRSENAKNVQAFTGKFNSSMFTFSPSIVFMCSDFTPSCTLCRNFLDIRSSMSHSLECMMVTVFCGNSVAISPASSTPTGPPPIMTILSLFFNWNGQNEKQRTGYKATQMHTTQIGALREYPEREQKTEMM